MEAAHFRTHAMRIERILQSGALTPAHHAILSAWYRNLTGIIEDEDGPRAPPGVMIFGLPDEARLALAFLIAGDLLEEHAREEGEEAAPPPMPYIVPYDGGLKREPAAAPAIVSALEMAKSRLRQVVQQFPGAVLPRNVQAALESNDISFIENEIGDISFRATQRAPS